MIKRLVLCTLLGSALQGSGQNLLRIQHLNTEDGLSQNSVNGVLQDSLGFIWVATGDGLNRYDGKEFVTYKSNLSAPSPGQLPDRNINSRILEDDNGRLWMASDAGLYFWESKHVRSARVLGTHLAGSMTLLALTDTILWGAVARNGVYAVNTRTLKHTLYPYADKFQRDPTIAVAVHNGAQSNEGIWMADQMGLQYFDRATHTDRRLITDTTLNSVTPLSDGRLLICAVNGVYFFDPRTQKKLFVPIKDELGNSNLQWRAAAQHRQTKDIYIGSRVNGAVCKLNPVTYSYELMHFQGSVINILYIDRSENLWVGTEGDGVFKLDIKPPKFFCYRSSASAAAGNKLLMVKSLYRDEWGKIWIGTYGKGMLVYDPLSKKSEEVLLPFPVKTIFISPIMKDSSGYIIAAGGDRVMWLEPRTRKVARQVQLPPVDASSNNPAEVYSMVEWKKNHYIVATNIGLYCINAATQPATAVSPNYFHYCMLGAWGYNLTMAPNGDMYFGARAGYYRVRITGDTALSIVDTAFRNLSVRHFYKSKSSPILWMASEQGLIAYNETNRNFKVFDESSGLLNSYVYAILPENDSSLWISTNQGISRVRVQYGGDLSISVTNFTAKDGLQSNEFNTGAFYKGGDGTMIFGGISGINWFNPKEIKFNQHKAVPAVAAIFVNDTLHASDTAAFIHTVELPYNKNTISLSLRALEYTGTGATLFAYKLEGLDKGWVYTSGDKVRYPNLLPGEYTFLLKAANNDGVWNEEPLQLKVIIHPPYWQTWWFRISVALGIVSLIALVIRYYIKQRITRKTIELEKQQALNLERLRISKDMHDDLGAGLSKISLMAELAQSNKEGVDKEIKYISTVSKDLIDNMRDLIWVLNPENTTLCDLIARIREYSSDYLEGMEVDVLFDFPEPVSDLQISREAQRNIFLTVKEAINNIVKHAGAKTIWLTLQLNGRDLRVSIQDDGRGFDQAQVTGGNGLRNMKHRIETLGGTFDILPGEKSGTTLIFVISLESMQRAIAGLQ